MNASAPKIDVVGTLAAVGTAVCWGSVPVMLRMMTDATDSWTANGIRYPTSACLYWPVLLTAWRRSQLDRRLVLAALAPSLFALIGQTFWGMAAYHLTPGLVGFLVKASIIWAMIAAMFLFPIERRLLGRPAFLAGLALSGAGFVVLCSSKLTTTVGNSWQGVAIILACSVFFGMYGVAVRYWLHGVPPMLAFALVSQYASIGSIALMLAFAEPNPLARMTPPRWGLMIFSSLVGIATAHLLFYQAIQRLGASLANLMQVLSPLVSAVLAYMIYEEQMTTLEWCAGAVMLVGAAGLLRSQDAVLAHESPTDARLEPEPD